MTTKADLAKDIAFLRTLLLVSKNGTKEDLEAAIEQAIKDLEKGSE